ncbi:cholesterol 7-desaturase nvd isoform X3 [Phycodurus eques]|uniref:cholesterol 7-desaturase nvd isoform X3 n=1 Tax=Phycodurus eques TaxID=693459 RepID=UPI002ACE41C5|nr:cholesterol 7-desaturase nvd isoform X3 [Phycodurus eques]
MSQNHYVKRVAASASLVVCALLFMQTGQPQGPQVGTDYSTWRDVMIQGADVCIIACVSLLLVSTYKLFFSPMELLKTLEDVGYIREDGRSKARTANDVRRRRTTGDLPPVYPNGWYRVLDSHMLEGGEVRDVTMVGVKLVVFRGEDEKAYVLDAYCPHLGANLAVGGRVVGNCIECPFHGWQFRGNDGKCERIPYAEKVPDFAKVDVWPSCEVNSQILVWFHCDGEDPQWIVPEQDEITRGEWVYRGRTEHFVSAHIEEIPENAADLSHLTHLHTPGIVSGVDLRYTNNTTWQFVRHGWKFERDVMIWNNKKYISKPLLVKEDSAIQKHRRWYSQFYSENSPRLQYQRNTLDF